MIVAAEVAQFPVVFSEKPCSGRDGQEKERSGRNHVADGAQEGGIVFDVFEHVEQRYGVRGGGALRVHSGRNGDAARQQRFEFGGPFRTGRRVDCRETPFGEGGSEAPQQVSVPAADVENRAGTRRKAAAEQPHQEIRPRQLPEMTLSVLPETDAFLTQIHASPPRSSGSAGPVRRRA